MNLNNICFDTNTLISYIFFIEPQNLLITKYINLEKGNFFITKHILIECENISQKKTNLLKQMINDMILFLDDNQDTIFDERLFVTKFLKLNNNYVYKDQIIEHSEIKRILHKIWNYLSNENIEGFTLLNQLNRIILSIDSIVNNHKNYLYSKFTLINNHTNEYTELNELLLQNNSHNEDNEIILDLYEYHLIHNIQFILVTFDKNFYNAIKKSNITFITKIYNLEDIKQITHKE